MYEFLIFMHKHVTNKSSWALLAPMTDYFPEDSCPRFAKWLVG